MVQEPRRPLKFIKMKCHNCSELNLIPVFRTLYLFEHVRCNFCGAVIMEFAQSNSSGDLDSTNPSDSEMKKREG
jgi:ribosomal protein S27E